jgi:indole-3-glycerol phosphate synthase
MANILDKILATKRVEVAEAKARVPVDALYAEIAKLPATKDFVGAIRAKHAAQLPAVIAEIKKQSPSAGQFRDDGDFDPARFAKSYEAHGAACLSVLTDRDYFGGCADDLRAARAACNLPIIRKDFIVDSYQIIEARAMGADAVLFIVDAAPIADFQHWEALAASLGLAVLVESHTETQIQDALTLKTPLIGINNRDLTRFETDLSTTLKFAPYADQKRLVVTESGIENSQAIDLMVKNKISTFLVGGVLMKASDPGAAMALLFSKH